MKYLSPTSLGEWIKSPEEFYLHRMAKHRRPRRPQTRPMSVGSAFDAYVKNYIHEKIIGSTRGTEYDLETMLSEQCEPHNLEWARIAGADVFNAYKISGALASLCQELVGEPRMEKTLIETVEGVCLLGKPDLSFTAEDATFVLDWKVNGYCSKASPKRGYNVIRDGWTGRPHSRSHGNMHKDCMLATVNGVLVNIGMYLESIDISWARQVATYSWLLGAPVGSEIYCGIDQIACSNGDMRIASFRMPISRSFQEQTMKQYIELWEICQDSDAYCTQYNLDKESLDNMYKIDGPMDELFNTLF